MYQNGWKTTNIKMVQIKNLQESRYSNSLINMAAIIVKVGDLKIAAGSKNSVTFARDVLLLDHSHSMINLIVRNRQAKDLENFPVGNVLIMKKVLVVRLEPRHNVVLMTVEDSELLDANILTQAIRLKSWHGKTAKNLNYEKMVNLSEPSKCAKNIRSHRRIKSENGTEKEQCTTQKMNISSDNLQGLDGINGHNQQIKRTFPAEDNERFAKQQCVEILATENAQRIDETNDALQQIKRTLPTEDNEPLAKQRCVKIPATSSLAGGTNIATTTPHEMANEVNLNLTTPLVLSVASTSSDSQQNTKFLSEIVCASDRKPNLSQKSENDLTSDDIANIISCDDMDLSKVKGEKDFEIKEEIKEDNYAENEEQEDIMTKEILDLLMRMELKEELWTENMDKHLIKHILKYATTCAENLQKDMTYELLLTERPEVFKGKTLLALKQRVLELAGARNYNYLLHLCGRDHIPEANIPLFNELIHKLRRSMQLLRSDADEVFH